MDANLTFFKNNVDFYSEEYRDYALKPWERQIVELAQGNILEVACGGGRITLPLLRRGYSVVGTDFVKEFEPKIRAHEAEFKGKFVFVEADMTKLPFVDGLFDTVLCINSLVYLKDESEVKQAVKEISRVLTQGGRYYITTWNIRHPLWGLSTILNYVLGRGKNFGETSPFWTTDRRLRNSKTTMYLATEKMLIKACQEANLTCQIQTSDNFMGVRNPLSPFRPILVVMGEKRG